MSNFDSLNLRCHPDFHRGLLQPPSTEMNTQHNSVWTTQQKTTGSQNTKQRGNAICNNMQHLNVVSNVIIGITVCSTARTVKERSLRAITFGPVGRIDNSMPGCEPCIWQQVGNPMFSKAIQCSFAIVPRWPSQCFTRANNQACSSRAIILFSIKDRSRTRDTSRQWGDPTSPQDEKDKTI